MTLTLLRPQSPHMSPPFTTASIKGTLATLFDLLEGEHDGDMLFFSRALTITGNTAPIVALRNTLDRENINLLHDTAALCGPFAKPAQHVIMRINRLAMGLRARHTTAYAKPVTPESADNIVRLQHECEKLRLENNVLIGEIAKFKVRAQRLNGATA